jgi:hypothetical protein
MPFRRVQKGEADRSTCQIDRFLKITLHLIFIYADFENNLCSHQFVGRDTGFIYGN